MFQIVRKMFQIVRKFFKQDFFNNQGNSANLNKIIQTSWQFYDIPLG